MKKELIVLFVLVVSTITLAFVFGWFVGNGSAKLECTQLITNLTKTGYVF